MRRITMNDIPEALASLSPERVEELNKENPNLQEEYNSLLAELNGEIMALKEKFSLKYERVFKDKEVSNEQMMIDLVSLL